MDVNQQINKFWSGRREIERVRLHWWQSKSIIRHINRRICGEDLETFSAGVTKRAQEISGGKTYARGISVGCGSGQKEMQLLLSGLVKHFHLFELSEGRLEQGRRLASKLHLQGKVTFHHGNAFELVKEECSYDLVHWNNSLHHMMNVEYAVKWSHSILASGGLFYMDDFIGPSRFQWTDQMLDIANRVRRALPEKYLRHPVTIPKRPAGIKRFARIVLDNVFSRQKRSLVGPVTRPTIQSMIDMDPSEAADSERILDMVRKYFPLAEIKLTGGVVYHLALNDIIHNIDETKDRHLLELLLILDDFCSLSGENHYAIALAIKE